MAFDLIDVVSRGAKASIMKNPAAAQIAALTDLTSGVGDLSTLGQFGTSIASVTSLAAQASDYVSGALDSLMTRLPLMSAADNLEKTLAALNGVCPGRGASADFQAAFGGLSSLSDTLGSVSAGLQDTLDQASSLLGTALGGATIAALTDLASQVPPAEIPDPDDPSKTIPNPAYNDFMAANSGLSSIGAALGAQVSAASSQISSSASTEAAAAKSGADKLRSMAFASFASRPQPPAVQDIISKFVNPPSVNTLVDKDILSVAGKSLQGSASATSGVGTQGISTGLQPFTDRPPAVAYPAQDTQTLTAAQLADFKSVLRQNGNLINDLKASIEARRAPIREWSEQNGYYALRDAARAAPNDAEKQSALRELTARREAETDVVKFNQDTEDLNKLVRVYNANVVRYDAAVNGTYEVEVGVPIAVGVAALVMGVLAAKVN